MKTLKWIFALSSLTLSLALPAFAAEGDSCQNSDFDCFPTSQYFCLNGKCVWKGGIDKCHSDFDCVFPEKCDSKGVCKRPYLAPEGSVDAVSEEKDQARD